MCSGSPENAVFIFRVSYTNFEPSFHPPAFNFLSPRAEKGPSYPLSVAVLQMTTNLAAYHSKYWLSPSFSGSGNWAWLSWGPLDKGLLEGCSLSVSQCRGLSKRHGRWKPTSRLTGIVVVRIQFSRVLHWGSQMLFECWLKASPCLRTAAHAMAEMTFHHLCHLLFTECKSQSPPFTPSEEITERHEYHRAGVLGVLWEAAHPTRHD